MTRALIFLFDGTDNDPTDAQYSDPTNVFNLNALIAEGRRVGRGWRSQVTFYQPGLGTQFYIRGGLLTRLKQIMFGIGLDEMVMRAYVNLASNYRPGDQIIAIGFSRGAVAARVFARLVSDIGPLKAEYLRMFSEAFDVFSDAIDKSSNDYREIIDEFRRKYANFLHEPPEIKFLGLFDCVCGAMDQDYMNFLEVIDADQSPKIRQYLHLMSLHDVRGHFRLSRMKQIARRGLEVWMPGVHSDIGGGYLHNEIAKVSLLSMARHLESIGEVRLDEAAKEKLVEEVNSLLARPLIVVNTEPTIIRALITYRKEYIRDRDKFHEINEILHGRLVRWKNQGDRVFEHRFDHMPVWRVI